MRSFTLTRLATITARLIFGGMFGMATMSKFLNLNGTAGFIASIGFPAPLLFATLAALFEFAIAVCFLSGALLREAAFAAAAYVLFLAFAFHGPSHWAATPLEFVVFMDHFTFIAGLLFAAAHGAGDVLAVKVGLIGRSARHQYQPA